MIHSVRLVVLAVTKVGDNSLVIHSLSSDWGRRSFIVKVGRKSAMSLFLPMNILDAEVAENPKSSLWRLQSIRAVHPLSGIRGNIHKNTMTLFMSEVLYRVLHDGANEEGLCEWCCKSILLLDAMEGSYANFHLRWLMELAGALGFSPSAGDLAPFAGERLKEMRALLQMDFAGSMLLPLNGETRSEIAESLLRYIEYHAEARIEVKSLSVLRELYS